MFVPLTKHQFQAFVPIIFFDTFQTSFGHMTQTARVNKKFQFFHVLPTDHFCSLDRGL